MASSRRIPALPALLAASALLLLPIGVAGADQAVTISGFAFHPATVTVKVGDTVTWTNNDGVSHTATSNNGAFDTEAIGSGSSASVTFNTAGSFGYHCEIHPSMHGTVVVQAASSGGGGGGGGVPGTDTVPAVPAPDGVPGSFALLLGVVAGGLIGVRLLGRRAGSG